MMTTNVGNLDRAIRWVVGAALILLGVFGVLNGTLAIVGYIVAAIALVTGSIRYCPLWGVCKINTAKSAAQQTA
jgi:hypothetical protein